MKPKDNSTLNHTLYNIQLKRTSLKQLVFLRYRIQMVVGTICILIEFALLQQNIALMTRVILLQNSLNDNRYECQQKEKTDEIPLIINGLCAVVGKDGKVGIWTAEQH